MVENSNGVRMKRLTEHTEAELLDLTDQQYKELVDLECSHEGIRLEPEVPVKPKTTAPVKDIVAWEIGSTIFATMEDATEVAALINSKKRMSTHYGSHYTNQYIEETKETKQVSEDRHYSQIELNKSEALIKKAEIEGEEYDKKLKEYKDVLETRTATIEKINTVIHTAKGKAHKIIELKRDYMRYLKLSDGQAQIAFNFLLDSRPDQREEIESLKTEIAVELITGK